MGFKDLEKKARDYRKSAEDKNREVESELASYEDEDSIEE